MKLIVLPELKKLRTVNSVRSIPTSSVLDRLNGLFCSWILQNSSFTPPTIYLYVVNCVCHLNINLFFPSNMKKVLLNTALWAEIHTEYIIFANLKPINLHLIYR